LLAKAASGQLARAIFNAAKSEHPERRIILRKDARVIVDRSSGKNALADLKAEGGRGCETANAP
jgi:hypothetical protein